ncbi:formaldehyde-responsive transcriptional repressor FrmR [Xenorhabdus bovienii]|uniref:formaldehyde-responsive transcriptional repressor FrmR n=1 Tax=Xenorhabdus bovienii TaxID=40576 RepID=UPI003DA53B93
MPHSPEEKKRVLIRVRKIKGQIEALESVLQQQADCSSVLQQIAAIRGAVNGLMAGVLESHLREELTNTKQTPEAQKASIEDAVSLIRTYLR